MQKASNTIKVLVVMPTLNMCGGIERFFMSYYNYMPRNIRFDIITHSSDSKKYKTMIESRGDNLFVLPGFSVKNYGRIRKRVNAIMQKTNYDVIHCQMANAGFLYLKLAKKYGIAKRILHSHQCKYADKKIHALRNIPLMWLAKKYANSYVACGRDAGEFMFGSSNYTIFNNAINPKEYSLNPKTRNVIRSELGVSKDELLLGIIGRLVPQKNIKFSIDIIREMKNGKLLIIGDGELKDEIKRTISELKLQEKITMLDPVEELGDYYGALDALVMPSLYEGLPYVGIEAQFMGLPCYFSSNITKELKISNNCYFIRAKDANDVLEWVRIIQKTCKKKNCLTAYSDNYNINKQAELLSCFYLGGEE